MVATLVSYASTNAAFSKRIRIISLICLVEFTMRIILLISANGVSRSSFTNAALTKDDVADWIPPNETTNGTPAAIAD